MNAHADLSHTFASTWPPRAAPEYWAPCGPARTRYTRPATAFTFSDSFEIDVKAFQEIHGDRDNAPHAIPVIDAVLRYVQGAPEPIPGLCYHFLGRLGNFIEYVRQSPQFAMELWYFPPSIGDFHRLLMSLSLEPFHGLRWIDSDDDSAGVGLDLGEFCTKRPDRFRIPGSIRTDYERKSTHQAAMSKSAMSFAAWIYGKEHYLSQLFPAYVAFNNWITELFPLGDEEVRVDSLRYVYLDAERSGHTLSGHDYPKFTHADAVRMTAAGHEIGRVWFAQPTDDYVMIEMYDYLPKSLLELFALVAPDYDLAAIGLALAANRKRKSEPWIELPHLTSGALLLLTRVYQYHERNRVVVRPLVTLASESDETYAHDGLFVKSYQIDPKNEWGQLAHLMPSYLAKVILIDPRIIHSPYGSYPVEVHYDSKHHAYSFRTAVDEALEKARAAMTHEERPVSPDSIVFQEIAAFYVMTQMFEPRIPF